MTSPASSSMFGRFSSWLAALIARRPRLVLAASLLLTLACLVPASRFRIDTRIESLLPEGAPAAEDYRTFLRTFGGFEKVFILVRAHGGRPTWRRRSTSSSRTARRRSPARRWWWTPAPRRRAC